MGRTTEKQRCPWSLRKLKRVWYVRFRHNGKRHEYSTGHTDSVGAEIEAAVIYAAVISGTYNPEKSPKVEDDSPTFQDFAEQWTAGELSTKYPDLVRLKRTAYSDESRLETHVYPLIGSRKLTSLTLDDALAVLRQEFSSVTRRHVAQLLSRVFSLAVYPCRHLKVSPLPKGFLPRLGKKKAKAALYPDEESSVMACETIPLANRILYGFVAREGMRSSEALRMTWSDLDLKRGAVKLDKNKTDDPRAWALDPGTAEALRRWRVLSPAKDSALVFATVENRGHLADSFRLHLKLAGVTREELFEQSNSRRQVRFHDLRATFVTVSLASGKTESWVTARTGHKSSGQVAAYRRLAEMFADVGAGWFTDLAKSIPELSSGERLGEPSQSVQKPALRSAHRRARISLFSKRIRRKYTGGDLNPYASRRWNLNQKLPGFPVVLVDLPSTNVHDIVVSVRDPGGIPPAKRAYEAPRLTRLPQGLGLAVFEATSLPTLDPVQLVARR